MLNECVRQEAAAGRQRTAAEGIFLCVGLALAVVVTFVVTRIARRALPPAVDAAEPSGMEGAEK